MRSQQPIPVFKVRIGNAESALEEIAEAFEVGYIGEGRLCKAFEREFGKWVGAEQPPLLLNSCTSAIDLACHLIGIGPGDEVIATPITCTATNSPPALRGATLVWADVDPLTGNIDPADVARKVTTRTKAIIAVNWGGRPCNYWEIDKATRGGEIPIIEDAAHGPYEHGGHGDYNCWSFQSIKHLAMGDGGALIVPPEQYERAKRLRWYGLDRDSSADFRCEQDIVEIGYKYQSNDILAAVGLANVAGAAWSVARSRLNAEWYSRALAACPGVTLPPFDPGASYWIYTILVDDRPSFAAHLQARGIATSRVHARNDKHSAFKAVAESRGPLPGVDHFDAHQIAIPNGWWVTERDRERIASAIWEWSAMGAGG